MCNLSGRNHFRCVKLKCDPRFQLLSRKMVPAGANQGGMGIVPDRFLKRKPDMVEHSVKSCRKLFAFGRQLRRRKNPAKSFFDETGRFRRNAARRDKDPHYVGVGGKPDKQLMNSRPERIVRPYPRVVRKILISSQSLRGVVADINRFGDDAKIHVPFRAAFSFTPKRRRSLRLC